MTAAQTFRLAAWRELRRSALLTALPTLAAVVFALLPASVTEQVFPYMFFGLAACGVLRGAGGPSATERYWHGLAGALPARLAGRWAVQWLTAIAPIVAVSAVTLARAAGSPSALPIEQLAPLVAAGCALAVAAWSAAAAGQALAGPIGALGVAVAWLFGFALTLQAAADIVGWPGFAGVWVRAGGLVVLGAAVAAWGESRGGVWRAGFGFSRIAVLFFAPSLFLGASLRLEAAFPIALGPGRIVALDGAGRVARLRRYPLPWGQWNERAWITTNGGEQALPGAWTVAVLLGPSGSIAVTRYRPWPAFHNWCAGVDLYTADGESVSCPRACPRLVSWRPDGRALTAGTFRMEVGRGCSDGRSPDLDRVGDTTSRWVDGHAVDLVRATEATFDAGPYGRGRHDGWLEPGGDVYDLRFDGQSIAAIAPGVTVFADGGRSQNQLWLADGRVIWGETDYAAGPDGLTELPANPGFSALDGTHDWRRGRVQTLDGLRTWTVPPVFDLEEAQWAWEGDTLLVVSGNQIVRIPPDR